MSRATATAGALRIALLGGFIALAIGFADREARAYEYVINGEPLPAEESWMLAQSGLPSGEYWIDELGNFGPVGSRTALFRIDEDGFLVEPIQTASPPAPAAPESRAWGFDAPEPTSPSAGPSTNATPSPSVLEPAPQTIPSAPAARPPARQSGPVPGVDGTRVFWIQTSILSNSGGSGYVHFCPGGRFYTSSEGSFSVSGAGGSASGAFDASSTGSWALTRSDGEAYVEMRYEDGDTGGYWLSDLTSGSSWRRGQWKYAAEPGRASCP